MGQWYERERGVVVADEQISSLKGGYYKVLVPVMEVAYEELRKGTTTLQDALDQGFDVDYNAYDLSSCEACDALGGVCGADTSLQFVCFCPDKPYTIACPSHGRKKRSFNWRICRYG